MRPVLLTEFMSLGRCTRVGLHVLAVAKTPQMQKLILSLRTLCAILHVPVTAFVCLFLFVVVVVVVVVVAVVVVIVCFLLQNNQKHTRVITCAI